MNPLTFAVCLIGFILPAVALKAADTPAQWRYVKDDDLLHGKVHDRFILDGVYLTPPHLPTQTPSIVVECSGGKVEHRYFNVGAVIHRDNSPYEMLEDGLTAERWAF